jgi:Enoyl-(Acyl carrier protein) reductase
LGWATDEDLRRQGFRLDRPASAVKYPQKRAVNINGRSRNMTQLVLIKAGANGIGLAIAKTFAASGARVHIADINAGAVAAITSENSNITESVGDIRNAGDLEVMFRGIAETRAASMPRS